MKALCLYGRLTLFLPMSDMCPKGRRNRSHRITYYYYVGKMLRIWKLSVCNFTSFCEGITLSSKIPCLGRRSRLDIVHCTLCIVHIYIIPEVRNKQIKRIFLGIYQPCNINDKNRYPLIILCLEDFHLIFKIKTIHSISDRYQMFLMDKYMHSKKLIESMANF